MYIIITLHDDGRLAWAARWAAVITRQIMLPETGRGLHRLYFGAPTDHLQTATRYEADAIGARGKQASYQLQAARTIRQVVEHLGTVI